MTEASPHTNPSTPLRDSNRFESRNSPAAPRYANAISYNTAGGWIRTRTSTQPGDQVQLIVENSGLGVATSNLENLPPPFSRGQDRTGHGVGLGLSIRRSIAEAHHGTITAQRNGSGGLTLTVELPTPRK
ncbi:MAG: sensor histidine kinase [Actinobacteria bacterium]|nr:sensor histidine kinase [Actinomycetota bacterium]